MEKQTLITNYINAYKNHFENDKRNNGTFENLQNAGYLLDKYYSNFTQNATYYKALYKKCLKVAEYENNIQSKK